MQSDYLHKNCYFEAEKVDNASENQILYFLLSFVNSTGFHFITKYAINSKFKFERTPVVTCV